MTPFRLSERPKAAECRCREKLSIAVIFCDSCVQTPSQVVSVRTCRILLETGWMRGGLAGCEG